MFGRYLAVQFYCVRYYLNKPYVIVICDLCKWNIEKKWIDTERDVSCNVFFNFKGVMRLLLRHYALRDATPYLTSDQIIFVNMNEDTKIPVS